ncbi:MAG: hypothetical protein ABJN40_06525 [Sneathiella sp.]
MTLVSIKTLVPVSFLFLAACGAATTTTDVSKEEKDIAKIAEEINKPEEEKVAALSQDEPAVKSSPEKEEKVVPRKDIPKVDVLMGKTVAEIETVFGKPHLRRKDKPAEVWQYLTSECALHLVFYPKTEKKSGVLTVQHIAMNDRQKAVTADATLCFGSQLRKVGDDRVQSLS